MMKRSIFSLMALVCSVAASAQIQSTYFLDNYTYSYRHNPANLSDKSFVGAAISNMELGLGSDVALSSIIFENPAGDGLVTGFNSSISAEKFLAGISESNSFQGNFDLNIFSLGLRRENTMTTFELNSRTFMDATVPGDLLRLIKRGSQKSSYDLSATDVDLTSYIELAFGRSHRVSETFSFGYRVKGLVGLASVYANLQGSRASLSEDHITASMKGEAAVAGKTLQFSTDASGKITGVEDATGIGPSGFGAAVDAGISWMPVEGLSLSASISDLGVLNSKYSSLAEANNSVNYNGADISSQKYEDVEEELDKVMDDLEDLTSFHKKSGEVSSTDLLPFRINASARYRFPSVQSLSTGVLVTYRNTAIPIIDARAAITYTPKDWVSFSGNLGGSNFGAAWGCAVNFCTSFLNFFFGIDGYAGPSVASIPDSKFSYSMNLGLVFRFGEKFE